jgi:hypothetical protein
LRKWIYIILALVIFLGILIYRDIYNPPLPISSLSKDYVLDKVSKSDGKIVSIAGEDGYQWYISEVKQGQEYKNLKLLMKEKGWIFKKQVNEGLVFQSEQGEITVLSRYWTKKYIIFYFPEGI